MKGRKEGGKEGDTKHGEHIVTGRDTQLKTERLGAVDMSSSLRKTEIQSSEDYSVS